MILKSGKFYDEAGNVVPLEHGNKEQIAILEKHRRRREAFEGDGLDLTINIETVASVSFPCVCGEWYMGESGEGDSEEDAIENMHGKIVGCPKCGQRYEIEYDGLGDVVAKFKK